MGKTLFLVKNVFCCIHLCSIGKHTILSMNNKQFALYKLLMKQRTEYYIVQVSQFFEVENLCNAQGGKQTRKYSRPSQMSQVCLTNPIYSDQQQKLRDDLMTLLMYLFKEKIPVNKELFSLAEKGIKRANGQKLMPDKFK